MGLIYSRMKVFHYKDKLDSLPRDRPEILPPVHIRIKPTNVCNHRCSYCAYREPDLQLGKDMVERDMIPRDKMMEIVDDIVDMDVKAVTFSGGGEPFCYKHLGETVARLRDAGIHFASLTNGSRLEGEVAEIFAQHASWIRVSIDGWDDASYARYRSIREGEWSKVMANMEAFKKLGGPCRLGVSLIVDQENKDHIFEFSTKLKNVGVDSVKIAPCILSNSGAENNRYHRPIYDDVRRQVERTKTLAEDDFEVFDSYHLLEDKFDKSYHWCPYLQILPIIGADLNIYSCQDKAYNLDTGVVGSIANQRFKEFWFSDKNKFFRIDPARDCSHHCVANAKNKLVLEYLETDTEHMGFV